MNPVVIVWVVMSAIGALLSTALSWESYHDVRAFENRANGRRWHARSRLWRESLRVTVHVSYIVAGLTVLKILPLSSAIVVPVLMYGNVVLVVNSLIDSRTRAVVFRTRLTDADLNTRQTEAAERTAAATERIADQNGEPS